MLSTHVYKQNFTRATSVHVHFLMLSMVSILSPVNCTTFHYICNELHQSHNRNCFPNTLFPYGSLQISHIFQTLLIQVLCTHPCSKEILQYALDTMHKQICDILSLIQKSQSIALLVFINLLLVVINDKHTYEYTISMLCNAPPQHQHSW